MWVGWWVVLQCRHIHGSDWFEECSGTLEEGECVYVSGIGKSNQKLRHPNPNWDSGDAEICCASVGCKSHVLFAGPITVIIFLILLCYFDESKNSRSK